MRKSTLTWSTVTRLLPLLTLMLISMSWTGCKTVVISADQAETFLPAGKAFLPPVNGWFMTETRYQRYRRAVADKIQALETTPNK